MALKREVALTGECGGIYPHALHDDARDIRCDLTTGHDGEHQDHSTSDVLCFSVTVDDVVAVTVLQCDIPCGFCGTRKAAHVPNGCGSHDYR
jgi:hypothetical protein